MPSDWAIVNNPWEGGKGDGRGEGGPATSEGIQKSGLGPFETYVVTKHPG